MPGLRRTCDPVRAQLGRVRRRWNRRELQRALYLVVALGAAAATVVLLLALRAAPRRFALATAMVGAAAAAGVAIVVARALRRRVSPARAPAWVDRRAGLQGRLATLVEVEPRAHDAFLFPVLRAQTLARLPAWTPRRMVPRAVPPGALATALAAGGLLGLTLLLAPALAPPPGEAVRHPAVLAVTAAAARRAAGPGAAAPAETEPGAEAADASWPAAAAQAIDLGAGEPSLASALQAAIRDRLWGEGWRQEAEPIASVAAATERHARAAPRPDAAAPGGAGEAPWLWEAVDAGEIDDPSASDVAALEAGASERADAEPGAMPGAGEDPAAGQETRTPAGASGGASGAGSGTDPRLFGAPSEERPREAAFQLGLDVHVRGGAPLLRPPSRTAPPAAADARPALGARSLEEAPVRRPRVPAAWEPVVQALFARQGRQPRAAP